VGDSVIFKSAKLMNSLLLFGFSLDMVKQFYEGWKVGKFQAFDYGESKNLEKYGSKEPTDYLANFGLIDIPIHYFISMDDNLIRADDILVMYETLRSHHPEQAYLKVFEGFSHLEFTYQSHHSMLTEVIQALKDGSGKGEEDYLGRDSWVEMLKI